jgi:hypothetical protein
MKIFKALLASLLLVVFVGGCAQMQHGGRKTVQLPPGTLNAMEITTLFSGKTVESMVDKSGRISLTYYNPNGELHQLQNGQKRSGTWRVTNDARICLQFEGDKEKCRIIVKEGYVYRKYIVRSDGNHERIITYTSFRDGNLVGR